MSKLSSEFREPNRKDKVTRCPSVSYARQLGLLVNTLGSHLNEPRRTSPLRVCRRLRLYIYPRRPEVMVGRDREWRASICAEVAANRISQISIYHSPPPHSLLLFLSILPTILYSTQVTVWRNQCAPKAGFGAVQQLTLVTLRKVSRRASCKALRWDKVIMIRRVCIVNIVLYSRFIWLNGSITLIRAEKERYDIVRFLR